MNMRISRLTLLVVVALSVLSIGCASKNGKKTASSNSEAGLYQDAQAFIKRGNYEDAIADLQAIEMRFPFGEYSKSAQLSLIYAYFAFEEPEAASSTADRFIRLHPQHRNVDYAYYMKGLISFPKSKTFLQRRLGVDLSKRDINEARVSFNHFSNLAKRFPKSEYTPDALKRMEFLRNLLARHEIHVANYYIRREAFLAAANRGRYVVENFQRTPAVPDALAVMAHSYNAMNIDDLSEKSVLTLKANFPDYPALKKDGSFNFNYHKRTRRSWFDIFTFGLLSSSQVGGFDTEDHYKQSSDKAVETPK